MKTPIVILHGWLLRGDHYHAISDIFKKHGYRIFAPDMPGSGEEKLTKEVMYLDDYVDWVVKYLKKNKLSKVIIVGHSFGGRVGAKLAATHPELVEKLVLTGAPLIKRKLTPKKYIISRIAKAGKKILTILPHPVGNILRKALYYSIGEWDYYKAGSMRETFKVIINEDLISILPAIHVPTLVVWGDMDTFVPLRDGKEIAAKIPGTSLDVIHDATHKLPYEMPGEFAESVLAFI